MRLLRATALYAVLTVLLTWPFAANLHVMDAGDSAFFAWEIGWTVHALKTDPAQLPHANIFWPLRYTLGMDEPVLGTTLLVAPLAPFTDDAVLLYNVARLLTFLASALAAYALARELGVGEAIALGAGALFAFSPIRTDQVAHLSTLGTQWWPLALLFTIRFARQNRARDALVGALFFVLSFLACGYHGVIAAAVMPPVLLVLFWGRWDRLKAGALAAVLAGLALLPVYVMHKRALDPEQYARGTDETVQYAASVESFLASSSWNRLYSDLTDPFRVIGPNNLFPGLVVPGLVVAGAVAAYRRKQRPSREAVAFAVLLVGAALVALGPRIRAFGHDLGPGPWLLLRDTVPLFRMIRVTSRAGVFLALPLVMLAALALARLKPRPFVLAGLFLLGLAETVIAPIPMPRWSQLIDTRKDPPAVYPWLASLPGRDPIVELPIFDVYALERRPAFHDSVYMVYSTLHWKPLANGYAGIEPRSYVRLRELSRGFPSDAFLDELRRTGVRYVVLHRKGYGPFQWQRLSEGLSRALASGALREVQSFGNDLVYEVGPASAALPLVDLAGDSGRQVVVDREPGQYLGHPTTVLLEDGRTILCVYPKGHGRGAIVLKRSVDGGRTWSARLPTPASWATSLETPTIHRTVDAAGRRRLLLFSGLFPIRLSVSEDDGAHWSELRPLGSYGGIVAMASLVRLRDGSHLAMFHDDGRYFRENGRADGVFRLYQVRSNDGGLSWGAPELVYQSADVHLCEPGLVRSPDGRRLAALLRENRRLRNSHVIFSDDEGRTWSAPRELPATLTGDRHVLRYAPDGRLLATFRDTAATSATRGDWVGWVGRWEDLAEGRPGEYRVRLMKNHEGQDCAYPGLELLPDGTFVATTYGHWTPGEPPYVVSVRFTLGELDARARQSGATP